jgi:uncharacterized membrane protein
MPYCTQCGKQIAERDKFCAGCGSKQGGGPAAPAADLLDGIAPRTASLLCYLPVVGWIPCIVVLATHRFRDEREVRFHAFQGLYLFVVWLLVDWVVSPMFGFLPGHALPVAKLLKLGVLVAWVFMLVKLAQNQTFRLPILGELAERSVDEQRS